MVTNVVWSPMWGYSSYKMIRKSKGLLFGCSPMWGGHQCEVVTGRGLTVVALVQGSIICEPFLHTMCWCYADDYFWEKDPSLFESLFQEHDRYITLLSIPEDGSILSWTLIPRCIETKMLYLFTAIGSIYKLDPSFGHILMSQIDPSF